MVRFVGKSQISDQTPIFGQILVGHLLQKSDIQYFVEYNLYILSPGTRAWAVHNIEAFHSNFPFLVMCGDAAARLGQ